ncbi:lipase family protein [bacterium]|nr:lipase family protein [bacterium]
MKILLCLIALLLAASGLSVSGKASAPAKTKVAATAPASHWSTSRISSSDLPCDTPKSPVEFDVGNPRTQGNAYLLMAASHLAYRFWPGRRERILKEWGFISFRLFDNNQTSTNGFWAEHEKFVLLVYRGTQEPTDLITDADVQLEKTPNNWNVPGRLHSGFFSAAQSVREFTLEAALLAESKRKPLILAGHSLGGAVAFLSAVDLEKSGKQFHSIWTFGAPKTGEPAFTHAAKKILGNRLHTVIQPKDPIPLLPFEGDERDALVQLAERYGTFLPLLKKIAANSEYDSAPSASLHRRLTQTSLKDFATGFWKHLPRSYVCDLADGKLAL